MDRVSGVMLSCCAVFVALWPSAFVTSFGSLFAKQERLPLVVSQGTMAEAAAVHSSIPDLFYHLGGNGPWIPKINGTVGEGIEPPAGCQVTQVHMAGSRATSDSEHKTDGFRSQLSRHAERYPTIAAGESALTPSSGPSQRSVLCVEYH